MTQNDTPRTDHMTRKIENAAYSTYDDEIDLFELVAGVWRKKVLIATITAAFALLAIVYVLLIATPSYIATGIARPTGDNTLRRVTETGVIEITPSDAFSRVVFEARSREVQRQVFSDNKQGLLKSWPPEGRSEADVFLESFLPALRVNVDGIDAKNDVVETKLTTGFEHFDPVYSARISNSLLNAAQTRARDGLLTELRAALSVRITALEDSLQQAERSIQANDLDQIARMEEADQLKKLQLQDELSALRQKAAALRQDRIVRLEEALAIAQSLNITEPTTLDVLARSNVSDGTGGEQVNLSANLAGGNEPDYLKGSKLLTAELQALKKRQTDEHHYPQIRELEEQLTLLANNRQAEILRARKDYAPFATGVEETRSEISKLKDFLNADYSDLQLIRIDQEAVPPRLPSKPKKKLIVIAATLAGGMLGVLLALIFNAVESRRRQNALQ